MESPTHWSSLVRPQLLAEPPLIWSDAHHVHWGDDPEAIEADEDLIRWVRRLDGTRTLPAVMESAPHSRTHAERLLDAAYRSGFVVDAAVVPTRWFWGDDEDRLSCLRVARHVLTESRGALGIELVNRLVDGRGRVHVDINDPHAHLPGLADAVLAAGIRVAPREGLTKEVVRLRVVCAHPDLTLDHEGGIPTLGDDIHLHVGLAQCSAVIGPLVIPGSTSCLRCAHLHRRDQDPHWPVRSVQYAHRRTCTLQPSALAGWVTSLTSRLLADWCDAQVGHRPDSRWRNVALRLTWGDDAAVQELRPIHPLCGCSWADPG